MGLLASFVISFATALICAFILYWLDRYEKEPVLLLGGVFLWGAVIAAGSSFLINTILGLGIYIFTGSDTATEIATGSIIAPLVEETLKGMAVVGVFFIFHNEFDSILDGIIYAGIVALGFSATENTYYIYNGFLEKGWTGWITLSFIRVVLVGWQHPFYTAFFGIGLALARLYRSWLVRIGAPILGLGLAMFTHAFHNTLGDFMASREDILVGAFFDWGGWLMMFAVLVWATLREQKYLKKFLQEEVQAGVITPAHFRIAVSAWRQMFSRLAAIFSGSYRKTARFYQVCGEYAHKRQQLATLGDESGNLAILARLRSELTGLGPYVKT